MSQKTRKPPKPDDVSGMMDLNLRFGLDSAVVRMPKESWGRFLKFFVVSGEDVVLRAAYSKMEVNYVLRGDSHLFYQVKAPDPSKKIPVFECFPISEMRKKMFEEAKGGSDE